jgi:hypothetical protein
LAHGCWDIWGGAANRLARALADHSALRAGGAPTLASEAAYLALCAAVADVSDALGVTCPPPPPWRGGGAEPADLGGDLRGYVRSDVRSDLRSAALALCGALATDRADPAGQHDPLGSAWLATGTSDAAAVAEGRRLLMSLERAFTGP